MYPEVGAHLWSIALDRADHEVERLAALLGPDERARAERFVFPRDRRRFVVARAALRTILGRYLDHPPGRVAFTYGPRGKPSVAGGPEFNLAHSHELALCAVARRAVGVDLEWRRPIEHLEEVAQTAFSPNERMALLALPAAERPDGFLRCWTRKEAYVKARGDGLHLPLDGFDVSLDPDDARLLASRLDPAEPTRWSLVSLEPAAGYVGALAIAGPPPPLRQERWESPA
jgi:4'-phosphopantetheinyl transferase